MIMSVTNHESRGKTELGENCNPSCTPMVAIRAILRRNISTNTKSSLRSENRSENRINRFATWVTALLTSANVVLPVVIAFSPNTYSTTERCSSTATTMTTVCAITSLTCLLCIEADACQG